MVGESLSTAQSISQFSMRLGEAPTRPEVGAPRISPEASTRPLLETRVAPEVQEYAPSSRRAGVIAWLAAQKAEAKPVTSTPWSTLPQAWVSKPPPSSNGPPVTPGDAKPPNHACPTRGSRSPGRGPVTAPNVRSWSRPANPRGTRTMPAPPVGHSRDRSMPPRNVTIYTSPLPVDAPGGATGVLRADSVHGSRRSRSCRAIPVKCECVGPPGRRAGSPQWGCEGAVATAGSAALYNSGVVSASVVRAVPPVSADSRRSSEPRLDAKHLESADARRPDALQMSLGGVLRDRRPSRFAAQPPPEISATQGSGWAGAVHVIGHSAVATSQTDRRA